MAGLGREPPRQHGDQVALLVVLPFQGWQQQLGLGDGGLLGQHIGKRDLACRLLPAQNVEQLRLHRDQALGGGDLAFERGELNGGESDVRRQREDHGLALELLHLDHRLGRLDLAPDAAEHVGDVGN